MPEKGSCSLALGSLRGQPKKELEVVGFKRRPISASISR